MNKWENQNVSKPEGHRISIVVSDPWDFGTVHGTGPFVGVVLAEKGFEEDISRNALIKLDAPLEYKGVLCEYFVADARSQGDSLGSISGRKTVPCALTQVPEEHIQSHDPFDLSWWRGGIALLADISVYSQNQCRGNVES